MEFKELYDWLLDCLYTDLPHPSDEQNHKEIDESPNVTVVTFEELDVQFVFDRDEIQSTCDGLQAVAKSGVRVHNQYYAELPYRLVGSSGLIDPFMQELSNHDAGELSQEDTSLTCGRPSNTYIAAMLPQSDAPDSQRYIPFDDVQRRHGQRINVFDVIRRKFDFVTLRIRTNEPHDENHFRERLIAFSFELSAKMEVALVAVDSVKPMRYESIQTKKQISLSTRCRYDAQPINYFQSALANDSPHYRYLAFYNVLEYFSEDHDVEAVANSLSTKLSEGELSTSDTQDIVRFVKTRLNRRERGKIKNVLEQLIDAEVGRELKIEMNEVADLANDICVTRNAIVHSKAYEEARYVPFQSDREIEQKLPIIHYLSELAIRKLGKKD